MNFIVYTSNIYIFFTCAKGLQITKFLEGFYYKFPKAKFHIPAFSLRSNMDYF